MEFGSGAKGTEDIYNGVNSKKARATLPLRLHPAALANLTALEFAQTIKDVAVATTGLHKLHGDRAGTYAVSIDKQYRICFAWSDVDGATEVEIVDYH